MGLNITNVHSYSDTLARVYTSALGVGAPPTDPTTALGAGWYDCGFLKDDGVTWNQSFQETKIYGHQGGGVLAVLRNQLEKPFNFVCAEENAVVAGLAFPGSTITSTGWTASVQTVTISGTPTGGTWTITVAGYGSYVAAYNVPTATLQTALTNLIGGTVTVSGTAGTSYAITFPSSLGAQPLSQVAYSLTGGSSPAATIAMTTPGVNGVNSRVITNYTGRNLRQFVIHEPTGGYGRRLYLPYAEATATGPLNFKGTDIAAQAFTLNPYQDGNGMVVNDLDNMPGRGSGLYA